MGRQLVTHVIEQQQTQAQAHGPGQPAPQVSPQEVARMIRGFSTVYAVCFVCLGAIYPLVALILLSRPGARAACGPSRREEENPGPLIA
jgi:hypothetical protein